MKKTLLTIAIISFSFLHAQSTFSYVVESIPFQEFQEQDVILDNQDDIYSGIIIMPFSFDFFNVNNTEFVVGSNGTVTFDTSLANGINPWNLGSTSNPYIIPSSDIPLQSILGPFHDIDNRLNETGGVYTGSTGVYPNRKFYVVFEDVPQFSGLCFEELSSFQIVMHETTGVITVNIKDKPACEAWNNGHAVLGLQGEENEQLVAIAAPDRNTGVWSASNEAWRFTPTTQFTGFNVNTCDTDNDGSEVFNIDNYKTYISNLFNVDPSANLIDVLDSNNTAVSGDVSIVAGDDIPENEYSIVLNGGDVVDVTFSIIECDLDNDNDGLSNIDEDVNGNGNLNDDDTDADGIPNYLDDDDDGDYVLTNIEIIFTDTLGRNTPMFIDTDNDGIYNHLDIDDDGDGALSLDEDFNGNLDPTDDDVNMNGVPDYLDSDLLNVDSIGINSLLLSIFPNPVEDDLTIEFASQLNISDEEFKISIYDYLGRLIMVKNSHLEENRLKTNISNLSAGNYLIIVENDRFRKAKKFIKH